MRFTRYKICRVKMGSNDLEAIDNLDENLEFKNFLNSKKMEDSKGVFAIPYCIHDEGIIVGNLSQSYGIDLIKFSENSKEEVPIKEDKANDNKTYFFINCKNAIIYIQNRKYSPKELNPKLAIERIECLLNKILTHEPSETIILQRENISYKIEELRDYFRTSFVKSVEFINVSDYELDSFTELHNPRIDLDRAVVESWNTYSRENVESIKIKAKKNKSIAKNPLANIGFKLAEQNRAAYDKIIKNIEIEAEGQKETLKPTGNEYFIINITDQNSQPNDFLYKIINYLKKK